MGSGTVTTGIELDKTALLRAQFAHIQPEGGHAPVGTDEPPYARMLAGIRAWPNITRPTS